MSVDLLRCALPTAPPAGVSLARADHPFVRAAALEALAAARAAPTRAGPTLSAWFRRARRLGSRDRRLVSAMVYDTLRHEGILTRAGALTDAQRLDRWGALIGGERFAALSAGDPEADYAAALSLPRPIAAQWLSALGAAEAAQLGAALSGRAPTTIRANRLRCTREQLAARLSSEGIETAPAAHAPDGLHVQTRANFPALQSFREGWFEVQDESSQRFCAAVGAGRGQTVLDLCAGAGGKSLAFAATGAKVHAHDVRPRALRELQKRAKRAGARVSVGPPKPADVVVIDAPCSGTGRLRRDPALRLGLGQLDLGALVQTQRDLIATGRALVRPGGTLVYATCSLLAAEHDHALPAGWALRESRLLWPHRGGGDGFSWRVWSRPGAR